MQMYDGLIPEFKTKQSILLVKLKFCFLIDLYYF